MKPSPAIIASSALAVLFAFSAPARAQESYATAWSGHANIVVNTAAAGIAAPVHRYPLLVRLDSTHATIFAQAKAGGADLRVTKADNVTRLPHQVERWDSAARRAEIWIGVDTLPHARNNFALRLHWGNAAAADSSSGARVFDTAAHFQAVWHFGGTGDATDATPNGFTAAQVGTPGTAPAVIGAGRAVSDGNYFRATGTASGPLNFPEGSDYTISAWVFTSVLPAHGTIVSKHDNAYALKLTSDASNWEFFEYGTDATAAGWNWVNAPTFNDFGVWRHITGVRSTFDVAIYVDGVRQDFGPSTAGSTAARVLDTDVVIGAQPTTNSAVQRPFDGTLDEVRMSNAARGADWIKLDFETQKPGSAVVRLMDTVPAAVSPARREGTRFVARASGDGLRFDVTELADSRTARVRLVVRDLRGHLVSDRMADVRNGEAAWNARDASGRLVPQGVYVVRLSVPGSAARVAERTVTLTH